MLIRVGENRSERIDLALAGVMSLVAGTINAVGFLIAGAFTANMTGNVSAMADDLAEGRLLLALSFAGLVLAFICGAFGAAFAIQAAERRGIRTAYAAAILVEALVLLVVGAIRIDLPLISPQEALLVTLCFVMGLQNAVTTLISRARVRTTHVSGMATDIGIELAAMTGDAETRAQAAPKLSLHLLTLACFAAGGIIGALLYATIGRFTCVLAALVLFLVAAPHAWRARVPGAPAAEG